MALHLIVWQLVGIDQLSPNSGSWLSLFLFKISKTNCIFLDNSAMWSSLSSRLSLFKSLCLFVVCAFAQVAKCWFFITSIMHWVKSMILGLWSFASVTELRGGKEHLKSNKRELLLSDIILCTCLEERMLRCSLKYVFVLESICVQRAHAELFPLHVRAVPAQYRCSIYSKVLSLLPSSASTDKTAALGAGSSRGSTQVTCWDLLGGTSSDPQLLMGPQVCPWELVSMD